MVGTLIKTMTNHGLCIGLIYEWFYDCDDQNIVIEVTWNDCDDTTECFTSYEDYETPPYHFYDKGRWWNIDENFWKFKRVLEGKCK